MLGYPKKMLEKLLILAFRSPLKTIKSSAVENVSFSVQLIHMKKRNDGMYICIQYRTTQKWVTSRFPVSAWWNSHSTWLDNFLPSSTVIFKTLPSFKGFINEIETATKHCHLQKLCHPLCFLAATVLLFVTKLIGHLFEPGL